MTIGAILTEAFRAKIYEPRQRNKDGMRWIPHRFPIKGGISLREVWLRDAMRHNPFIKMIVEQDNGQTNHLKA